MCGILGAVPAVDASVLQTALATIAHRGPDEQRLWSDGQCSLAFARLAIIDVTASGGQPMISRDGRYAMVFNGEIYNWRQLRDELEQLGEDFASHCDAEVVLIGYRVWGEKFFLRANGMWAVAIWEADRRRLFLSRDRFGKKPLFFAWCHGSFVFASEMKAIFPFLDEVRPSRDFSWCCRNIFSYEATNVTLVEGIQRLPAAHHMYVVDGRSWSRRYWETAEHLVDVPRTYEERVERYRDLLTDSCKLRLGSDVPIALTLSGGIDSAAILATSSRLWGTPSEYQAITPRVVTCSFRGSELDERRQAIETADSAGLVPEIIEVDAARELPRLLRRMYEFEDIYITMPLPMASIYEAISRMGCKVSIDGHGADETLGGYPISVLEAGSLIRPREVLDACDTYRSLMPSSDKNSFQDVSGSRAFVVAFWLYRRIRRQLQFDRHARQRSLDGFGSHLYSLTHTTILPTLLRNYDRYSMMNGVEVRCPFLDHRLVSYTFSLREADKLAPGKTKRILRDCMSPLLPEKITNRQVKIGWAAPLHEWFRGPMGEFVSDEIESRAFRECSLVNQREVRRLWSTFRGTDHLTFKQGQKVWMEIQPYLWEKAINQFAVRKAGS